MREERGGEVSKKGAPWRREAGRHGGSARSPRTGHTAALFLPHAGTSHSFGLWSGAWQSEAKLSTPAVPGLSEGALESPVERRFH